MINKTVAVVVTYNRKELLRKCITQLLAQESERCDVLIVNNASDDGTEEMIKNDFLTPEIIYYNTGANLGGAGGFEYGVEKAVSWGYEYIWLMDDDTLPEKNSLKKLFEVDKELNGNWGFLSSLAYWTDGSICRMNIQKKTIFRHVGMKEYSRNFSPIVMCSFVSLLVKASVVKEVGLPIGEYFIWTDDYEFTGRISRKHPCYMVPESKVVHAMKTHTRVNIAIDSSDRVDRYRYIYRNDVHCYRQYGLKGWLYIILKDLYTVLNILINADNKIEKIKILFAGLNEGMSFHPVVKNVKQ
jgi:GT2 family glycosyltransferase